MTQIVINLEKLVTAADKFEERKAIKIQAVKDAGEAIMQVGFPFDTPEHGRQHLQTRNDTDRTNWLTSQAAYQAQVAFGNGDVLGATFRTSENNTITRTFNEGYQLILQMAAWGANLYAVSWAKQDAIRLCTTDAELDAISVENGWE